MSRVLVLAPHPDDETLGCGGVLLRHRALGDELKVVFLTDGGAGDPGGLYRGREYAALREREARRAAEVLGVRELEFWRYADRKLSKVSGLGRRLADLLRRESPEVVYRTSLSDRHPDHRHLASVFRKAARASGRSFADLSYEIDMMPRPTHVADIGRQSARKLEALRRYRSQLRYADYGSAVEKLALLRGLFLPGRGRAEAFRLAGVPPRGSVPPFLKPR